MDDDRLKEGKMAAVSFMTDVSPLFNIRFFTETWTNTKPAKMNHALCKLIMYQFHAKTYKFYDFNLPKIFFDNFSTVPSISLTPSVKKV